MNRWELEKILECEKDRQRDWLELIASENYVSSDVMMAYANQFTNKYSEGNPWARYYGGNEIVDSLERATQYLALALFGFASRQLPSDGATIQQHLSSALWWVNVQPLSGSPANVAVYLWVLKPGDTVLAMDLNAWWHLSHGHKLNLSSMYYRFIWYGVRETDLEIDYEDILQKALENKPAMIIAWFSAYPKSIKREKFIEIVQQVEKVHGYRPLLMADIAHIAWLIAWWAMESPFPYFDIVTTTTHKTLRGPRWALIYYRKDDRDLEKKINRGVFPWLQWWPHEHVIYAKAVAFEEALSDDFAWYAKNIIENAKVLAHELVALGWNVLTWTTENHIVLLDVTTFQWAESGVTWKIAERVLEDIWISVNKNLLPFDKRSAMDPSGIRLWTPAITTRWLWTDAVKQVGSILSRALQNTDKQEVLDWLKQEVKDLCSKYPLWY